MFLRSSQVNLCRRFKKRVDWVRTQNTKKVWSAIRDCFVNQKIFCLAIYLLYGNPNIFWRASSIWPAIWHVATELFCTLWLSLDSDLTPSQLCRFAFKLFNGVLGGQGPHSHILMIGGGGVWVIFLGLKFWQKWSFWWKTPGFFRVAKKKRFFWVAKRGLRDFLGMLKNVVIFLGRRILKMWSFWV